MKSFKQVLVSGVFGVSIVVAIALIGVSAQAGSGLFGGVSVAQAKNSGGSYGYKNNGPQGFVYVQFGYFVQQLQKWNISMGYIVQNVKDGSVTLDGIVVVNNISQSGSVQVLLIPNTTHNFKLFSGSNGKGQQLDSFNFTAPSYGYGI